MSPETGRPDLSGIDLLTFDCYGTLIDWESGIQNALGSVLSSHGVTISSESLLSLYAELESVAQKGEYRPYRDILAIVMRQLTAHLEVSIGHDESHVLANSIKDWPPFPDTREALQKLHERVKLAVISNIDDDLFEESHKQLGVTLDYVVTAEQAKAYKPSISVFEHAFKTIPVSKERILHVAQSLYHDIAPCNEMGIRSVWVNRPGTKNGFGATPPASAEPNWVVESMAGLVSMLLA